MRRNDKPTHQMVKRTHASKAMSLAGLFVAAVLSVSIAEAATTKSRRAPARAPSRAPAKATVGDMINKIGSESRGAKLKSGNKNSTAIPKSQIQFNQTRERSNLSDVKPPRTADFYKPGGLEAEYEKTLNAQMKELFKLTTRFKNSPNRGELWLRLAELYNEKAQLIEMRKQEEYQRKLKVFNEGKSKVKPVYDGRESSELNNRAIQLYEWFLRDFGNDPKVGQALYFLGYSHFQLGNVEKAIRYYDRLIKDHPKSPFVGEAQFAMAEYYFENDKWDQAYKNYSPLLKNKKHSKHMFALYKSAWCLYRLGKYREALGYMEYIIKNSRSQNEEVASNKRTINKTKLETEALRDIVVFYANYGKPEEAVAYFRSLVGGKDLKNYIDKLAYFYADRGNKDAAADLFRILIAEEPANPKAFDYQYQIVQGYFYTKNNARFKEELYRWIKDYGPKSAWAGVNANNKELTETSDKLRETTLRNYILQQHQTAQNSRNSVSQQNASQGYKLYFEEFPKSEVSGDMHFYYGELLYDMQKFDEASLQYKWVVDNTPTSKFAGKSAQNLIIAVEKSLPSEQEMQKRVGDSVEKIALDPRVDRYIKVSNWFVEKFGTSDRAPEIRFRAGRMYYLSNHFDEAIVIFKEIVQKYPQTKYAEYSANLLLDIYNLKKDYIGLEKTAGELLSVKGIANSKAGSDIKDVLEKASFKRAQDLEAEKNYLESAKQFEIFAKQNPKSDLAVTAMYNAGVNYEKVGQVGAALLAYRYVMASNDPKAKDLKPKAKRFLAKLYQDAGQFEEAAKTFEQVAREDLKNPAAANYIYNAAVLYEALGQYGDSVRAYNQFIDMTKRYQEKLDAIFSVATLYRKGNQISSALNRYKEYYEGSSKVTEKMVEAAYWSYELNRRRNSVSAADDWRKKTIGIQRRLSSSKSGPGAEFVAKIKIIEMQATLNTLKKVRFPANPANQKAAANKMQELIVTLKNQLSEIISYNSPEELVSGLYYFGEGNNHFAQSILTAPLPQGLNADELKQYKEGVAGIANTPLMAAKESYKKAVNKAQELESYGPDYRDALAKLKSMEPESVFYSGEVGSDSRLVNWMGN